jgi:hypothetical protein
MALHPCLIPFTGLSSGIYPQMAQIDADFRNVLSAPSWRIAWSENLCNLRNLWMNHFRESVDAV